MKETNFNIQGNIPETELQYHIKKFFSRIDKEIGSKYVIDQQNKLDTLVIKKSLLYQFMHMLNDCSKYEMNYDINKNKIKYNDEYIYLIYQTLFNVITTKNDKKYEYQGLSIGNNGSKKRFGRGLNKGYTLLLVEKYFCDENKGEFYGRHEKSTKLMKEINLLIGEDEMLSFYMNSDLSSFQNKLLNYMSCDEINKFILLSDKLYDAEEQGDYLKIGSLYYQAIEYVKIINNNKGLILVNNK